MKYVIDRLDFPESYYKNIKKVIKNEIVEKIQISNEIEEKNEILENKQVQIE